MDYDYWATVDEIVEEDGTSRHVGSTSPLDFHAQDEDFLSTQFLLREMMPLVDGDHVVMDEEAEDQYRVIRQHSMGQPQQVRTIKMCK